MEESGKTILILGNGFDLAHGLPTKYSHFLEFCKRVEEVWNRNLNSDKQEGTTDKSEQDGDLSKSETSFIDSVAVGIAGIRVSVQNNGKIDEVILDDLVMKEMLTLFDDNIWYLYFKDLYELKLMKGENWIDFESEIRFIIKEVDVNTKSLTDVWEQVIEKAMGMPKDSRLNLFEKKLSFHKYTMRKRLPNNYVPKVKDFREKAFEDLERLTRALELYLSALVEKLPINVRISEIERLDPDYVINFNYTDTYERIYKKGKVYYIHGKADAKQSIEHNNMVLGIDEYWIGDEQNERTNFTIFKKFAQRIQKHTGNESYKYLMEMQKLFRANKDRLSGNIDINNNHPDGVSYVYVFGHSLDVTDKDILSSYFGDDATAVTVYCMDKGTEGELIANTIKLITEKRLLEKVNHVPTKLRYRIP